MKRLITILLATMTVMLLGTATPALAATDTAAKQKACESIGGTYNNGNCSESGANSGDTINKLIKTVVDIFSWVAGIVSVLMVMFGGFLYVTSAGDASKAAKGRSTILYALVGLVIVALAQLIVMFTIGSFAK